MNTQAQETGTKAAVTDEELADVLTAISVVSKRLARKLQQLLRQDEPATEGGKTDGQDE